MIAYLKGQILQTGTNYIVLVVHESIGYKVFCPSAYLERLTPKTQTELFIHTHITENAFDLYGFSSKSELEFFEQLISVSGIGPKTGLELITLPIGQLKAAIIEGNAAFVSQAKGIGKKTAERVCLELKDKINPDGMDQITSFPTLDEDALAALVSLGYDRRTSEKTLSACPPELQTTEDRIKWCLQNF